MVADPSYYPESLEVVKIVTEDNEPVEEVMDIESLGIMSESSRQSGTMNPVEEEEREMITPVMRQKLTKEGYKLIGSHSGIINAIHFVTE